MRKFPAGVFLFMLMFLVMGIVGERTSLAAISSSPSEDSAMLPPTPPCGTLGGTIVDSMETLGDWSIGWGGGANPPTTELVPGYSGMAIRLNYDLGTSKGAWVQLRRDFDPPLDLSASDHLRFLHQGTQNNSIEVGMVSTEDSVLTSPNYFGSGWNKATNVPWWTYATWDFADFRKGGQPFPDFSQVKAIFISVVNKAPDDAGGSGTFTVDELQQVNLASRPVPSGFVSLTVDMSDVQRAAAWIGNQQQSNGLLKSWYEEVADFAWLYDQALGLLVLSETDLAKARLLADRLHTMQNADGSWYFGYHYDQTNIPPIELKKDVGPIAWLVYALTRYSFQEADSVLSNTAYQDARQGAAWMAAQQKLDGSLGVITEWNLDAWWAFQATGYQSQADRLRDHLLNQVWDNDMGRFKSSSTTYHIFLDNQTWGAPFLRALGRESDARKALSYAQAALLTTSSSGALCGFDGGGPFSIWNEGTFQYIALRGDNSPYYWEQMVSQQAVGGLLDGSMPNSPDNYQGYMVWLSTWHGIAPTAWLYFAGTGGPFTNTPPLPPKVAPTRNYYTTATPTLTWNQVTWSTEYEVQVDSSSAFTMPLSFAVIVPGNTLSITTTTLSDGTYFWRVRAKKIDGTWGAWSITETFTIDA